MYMTFVHLKKISQKEYGQMPVVETIGIDRYFFYFKRMLKTQFFISNHSY